MRLSVMNFGSLIESTGQEKPFEPNSPALEHGSAIITALHSECLLV